MTELAIHRFELSLVRKGGSGWGEERERIFAAIQHALPAALGEALEARVGEGSAFEIADPIRLDVQVSLAELAAACASPDAMAMFARQIIAAWTPPEPSAPELVRIDTPIEERAIDPAIPSDARDPEIATLLEWHRRAELVRMLAGFSTGALRRWFAAIVPTLPGVEPSIVEALVREDTVAPRAHEAEVRDILRDALA